VTSRGNAYAHLVLRGGGESPGNNYKGTNFDVRSISEASGRCFFFKKKLQPLMCALFLRLRV